MNLQTINRTYRAGKRWPERFANRTPSPLRGEGWGEGEQSLATAYVKSPPLPNPEETTSRSTKPANGQVDGYLPQGGEGTDAGGFIGCPQSLI